MRQFRWMVSLSLVAALTACGERDKAAEAGLEDSGSGADAVDDDGSSAVSLAPVWLLLACVTVPSLALQRLLLREPAMRKVMNMEIDSDIRCRILIALLRDGVGHIRWPKGEFPCRVDYSMNPFFPCCMLVF